MLGLHLVTMRNGGRAAQISAGLIRERHALPFYGLGLGIGVLLPLALGVYLAIAGGPPPIAYVAVIAASRLLGDVVIRDVILKVGVYDKVR